MPTFVEIDQSVWVLIAVTNIYTHTHLQRKISFAIPKYEDIRSQGQDTFAWFQAFVWLLNFDYATIISIESVGLRAPVTVE